MCGLSAQASQVRHSKTGTLLSDLKLNYYIYFLCKEEVPIADLAQQVTDLFEWDPSETSNYQETDIAHRR